MGSRLRTPLGCLQTPWHTGLACPVRRAAIALLDQRPLLRAGARLLQLSIQLRLGCCLLSQLLLLLLELTINRPLVFQERTVLLCQLAQLRLHVLELLLQGAHLCILCILTRMRRRGMLRTRAACRSRGTLPGTLRDTWPGALRNILR